MPFTVAHTGIVLPLKKWRPGWFSLTGLMAGAMSPDLLYFLLLHTSERGLSHSWAGLLLFCLPAGLAFSFAFHWLFKYHIILNLPAPFDRMLSGLATSRFAPCTGRDWVVLISSVALGTLTHFGWDSFTHARGEIAIMLPFLTQSVVLLGRPVPVTVLAQHSSTVFGFLMIGWFVWKRWNIPLPVASAENRTAGEKLQFWIGCGMTSGVFTVAVYWFFKTVAPELVVYPVTTLGLSSWAGLFWAVAGYTVIKFAAGHRAVTTD